MSELLKRIEERKLERAVKSNYQTQTNSSQNTQDLNYEKRKRKAENLNECSIENIIWNENIPSDVKEKKKIRVSDHRKSKKKKNAAKALQNENTDDQNNEIFNKSLNSIETQEKIADQCSDFIIMGTKSKQKKHKVKRILPEWLSNPKLMSIDLNSGPTLEEMNLILDIKLITALKANNINKLFPVQANMISWLLKCDKDREQKWWLRDACISAPTGSGMEEHSIYN